MNAVGIVNVVKIVAAMVGAMATIFLKTNDLIKLTENQQKEEQKPEEASTESEQKED